MSEADSRGVVEADSEARRLHELGGPARGDSRADAEGGLAGGARTSAATGSASERGGQGVGGVQRWELAADARPKERS